MCKILRFFTPPKHPNNNFPYIVYILYREFAKVRSIGLLYQGLQPYRFCLYIYAISIG